jgi:uncharacterized Tic20 family protein/DNA-directed RNA polymerase subunit RPC12/RpoP
MPIEIACPSCGAKLKAPEQLTGKVIKCPRCTARVLVQPAPAEPAATTSIPPTAVATSSGPRSPAPAAEEGILDELPEVDDDEAAEDEAVDAVLADDEDEEEGRYDDRPARRKPRKRRRRSHAPDQDECNTAMLIYVLGIFTGFIGPLVLWMMKKDQSRFVDHHGKQMMNFTITVIIAAMVLSVVGVPVTIFTFGVGLLLLGPLFMALHIGALVICIMNAMKANRGEWSEVAVAIKFFH